MNEMPRGLPARPRPRPTSEQRPARTFTLALPRPNSSPDGQREGGGPPQLATYERTSVAGSLYSVGTQCVQWSKTINMTPPS